MPRWADDDWESEAEGDELDSAGEENGEPTIPCPYCRKQIHEDSPRCPHCENYLSGEDAPPVRKPWWLVGGVLVCLVLVYLWSVR